MRSIIVFLGGHVYVLGIIFLLLIFKDEFPKNWSMTWIFFAPLPTVLKSGFPQSKSPSNIISPVIFMKLPKGPKPVLFPRSLFIFRRRGKPLKQSRSFTEDRSTEVEEEYKSEDRRSLHAQIDQFFGSLVIFSAPIFFRSLFSLYFLSFFNRYITPENHPDGRNSPVPTANAGKFDETEPQFQCTGFPSKRFVPSGMEQDSQPWSG